MEQMKFQKDIDIDLNLIMIIKKKLESFGLIASGTSPDGSLVEIIELKDHPFFIAGQFHPEFKSRPDRPAPLFKEFIKMCKEN